MPEPIRYGGHVSGGTHETAVATCARCEWKALSVHVGMTGIREAWEALQHHVEDFHP